MHEFIEYFSIERLQNSNHFISLWRLIDDFNNGHTACTRGGMNETKVFDNCVKYLRIYVMRPNLNDTEVSFFSGLFNKQLVQYMSPEEKFEWNYHCYMTIRGFLNEEFIDPKMAMRKQVASGTVNLEEKQDKVKVLIKELEELFVYMHDYEIGVMRKYFIKIKGFLNRNNDLYYDEFSELHVEDIYFLYGIVSECQMRKMMSDCWKREFEAENRMEKAWAEAMKGIDYEPF